MVIVGYSNCWRGDAILGELKVWRGITLTLPEIEDYKNLSEEDGRVNLQGFTSTQVKKEPAEANAMQNVSVKEKPVVVEIIINRPWWRFEMNKAEFSAYFETENEVLI